MLKRCPATNPHFALIRSLTFSAACKAALILLLLRHDWKSLSSQSSVDPSGCALWLAPFAELLPGLDEFLHGAGRGECAAVDDAATAIGLLIEIQDRMHAEVSETFVEGLEVFGGQGIFALGEIRAAGHSGSRISFSLFLRHCCQFYPSVG